MCFKVSWHDRILAGVQKFSSQRKRLVAGWVWLRCQKEMERKINGLFVRSTFLWSPPPSPSGRYPLMYRWSPRTGRLIFFCASLLISVAWPGLWSGTLIDGVGRRQQTAVDCPFQTFPLIHGHVCKAFYSTMRISEAKLWSSLQSTCSTKMSIYVILWRCLQSDNHSFWLLSCLFVIWVGH